MHELTHELLKYGIPFAVVWLASSVGVAVVLGRVIHARDHGGLRR